MIHKVVMESSLYGFSAVQEEIMKRQVVDVVLFVLGWLVFAAMFFFIPA